MNTIKILDSTNNLKVKKNIDFSVLNLEINTIYFKFY